MKKLITLFFLLTLSIPTYAENKTEQWMCSGYGTINTGGPSGPITIPIQGRGSTEFEAASNTLSNCRNQGLQMCMISSCWRTNK